MATCSELMNKAFDLFTKKRKKEAAQIIVDTISNSEPAFFYAWWLTDTNPEYCSTSKDFLTFVRDVVDINRESIIKHNNKIYNNK